MEKQLEAWDVLLVDLNKDPFFKKVAESQKAFANELLTTILLNSCDYKLAYDHNFPGVLGF